MYVCECYRVMCLSAYTCVCMSAVNVLTHEQAGVRRAEGGLVRNVVKMPPAAEATSVSAILPPPERSSANQKC